MQQIGETLRFSATDLVGHVDCHHLTALDAAVARGELEKPRFFDPLLQALFDRGLAHEHAYVEYLRQAGHDIVEIDGPAGIDQTRVDKTIGAMRARAGAHRPDRLVYTGLINPGGPIDLDNVVSRLTQVLYVGVFVCKTAIE